MPTRHVQPHEGEALQTIADMILRARKIVVVTGAGISTNSGIPDFRSENGLYSLIQAQFEAAAAREAAVQEAADSQLSPATPSGPEDNDEANGNERPRKRPRVSAGLPEDRRDASSTPPEPDSPAAAAAASIFAPTATDPTRSTPPRHALFLDPCAADPSSPLSSPPPTASAMTTPPSRPSPEPSDLAAHLADPASFSTITIAAAAASSSPLSSPPPQALFDPGPASMSRQSSASGSVTSSSIGTSTTPSEVSSSDGWAESSCPYMLSQASQAVKATLPNMKGRDLFDSQIWADPVRTSVFYTFTTTLRQWIRDARPTGTHYFISHLRDSGKLVRCYTQNIDRIEEKVGLSTSLAEGPGSRGRFSRRSLGAAGTGGGGRRGGGIKIEATTTATATTTPDLGPGADPKPQQDGSQTTRESSVQPPPALSQSSTTITEASSGPSDTTPATADPADDDPDPDRAKSRASRGVECVFLHGSLQSLRCFLCGRTSEWDADDREAATLRGRQPECPHCVGATTARLERGKRALGIGKLRPDIVLYGEEHPSSHLISPIVRHDLGLCPDLLLILGTSLRVHGLKVMVREFAKAVHERGQVVFVNFTRPSESLWGDVIDMWVEWDCDAWVADLRGRIPALWGQAAVAEVAAAKAASKAAAKAAYKAAADAAAASKRLARMTSRSLKAAGPGERELAAPSRGGSGGGAHKKRKTGPCQEVAAGEVGTRKKRTPLPMASGRNHSDDGGNGNGNGDDKEGGDPSAAAAPKPPEPNYVFTGAIRPQALREDHTNAAYLTQRIMQQLRRITRRPPLPRAPGLFTTMAVATATAASAPSASPRESEDRGEGDTVPKPGHRPKKPRKPVPTAMRLQKTGKKRPSEQGAAAEPTSTTPQPEGPTPAPAMMIPAPNPATFGTPVPMAPPAQRPISEQADGPVDTSAATIPPLRPLTFGEPAPVASVHNLPSANLVQQQQEPISISNPTRISTTLTPLLPVQTPIPGPTWITPPGKAPSLRPIPRPLVLAPEPIAPLPAGQLPSDSVQVPVPAAGGDLLPDPGPVPAVPVLPILPGDSGPAPAPADPLLSDSGPVPVPADHLPPDSGPIPIPADHPLLPHWRPVPVPVGPVPAPWPPPPWSPLSQSSVWPIPSPEPERLAGPLATASSVTCPTSTAVSAPQLGPGLEPAPPFLAPAFSPLPPPPLPLPPPQLGPGSRQPTPPPDEYNILAAVKANARIRKRRIIGGEEICLPVVRSRSRGRNTATPLITPSRLLLPLPPPSPPAPARRSPSADLCEESLIANTLAPMLAWSSEGPEAAPSAYPARPEPIEPTLQIEVTSPLAPKSSPRRENTTTRFLNMEPFAMLTDPLINYPRPPPAGPIRRGIGPGVDDWDGRAGLAGEELQARESPKADGGPGLEIGLGHGDGLGHGHGAHRRDELAVYRLGLASGTTTTGDDGF